MKGTVPNVGACIRGSQLNWLPLFICLMIALQGEGNVRKTSGRSKVRITVNIKAVKVSDVSPAQKAAYRRFWSKLISQVNDELNVIRENAANNLEKTASIEIEPMLGDGAKEDKNP